MPLQYKHTTVLRQIFKTATQPITLGVNSFTCPVSQSECCKPWSEKTLILYIEKHNLFLLPGYLKLHSQWFNIFWHTAASTWAKMNWVQNKVTYPGKKRCVRPLYVQATEYVSLSDKMCPLLKTLGDVPFEILRRCRMENFANPPVLFCLRTPLPHFSIPKWRPRLSWAYAYFFGIPPPAFYFFHGPHPLFIFSFHQDPSGSKME